jgi:purine-cytosine permease-like protein
MPIPQVTLEDFQKVLTPQSIKVLQVIYFALGTGVFIFAVIAIASYFVFQENYQATDPSLIRTLTFIHLLLLPIIFYLAKYLYDRLFQFNRFSQRPEMNSSDPENYPVSSAENLLAIIRTSSIVRLALLEGLAMFGLTICFLGAIQGVLQQYPIYWLNMISTVIFEMIIFTEFPSRQKLETLFREKWSQQAIYKSN